MRATMLQVMRGERPIPMTMVGPVQIEQPFQPLEELPLSEQPKQLIPSPDGAEN